MIRGIHIDHADDRVAARRNGVGEIDGVLRIVRVGLHLSPVTSTGANGDRAGGSQGISRSSRRISVELVGALRTVQGTGDDDLSLTGRAGRGDGVQLLEYGLTTDVPDRVGLLVQDEAIVNEPTLNKETGDAGRVVVDLILFELLRANSRDGVGDDASRTGRQTAGGDLHDLATVNFADDALDEHLLRRIAVAHKSGVLLEQVGKAIGAESHTTLIGDIAVAQRLHALQEQGVGVLRGRSGSVIVLIGDSRSGEGVENIRVELRIVQRGSLRRARYLTYPLHISM